jgi:hypothetical protein
VKRLRAEDDYHAGEPGQRHRYLSRDPERFVRFHISTLTSDV